MKYKIYLLLLILPVLASFGLFTQSKSNLEASSFELVKTWQINSPAFLHFSTESYTLNSKKFGFGHFIEFKENGTFEAYYRASCGNDCFTKSKGSYTLKNDTLEIFVLSAEQTGFCLDAISYKNKKMGSFKIIKKTNDIFSLKKI